MARLLLLFALCGLLSEARADVTFVRVWPQWQDSNVFKRISEYFTGRENTSGLVIRRTHPGTRAGYYYLVRVRHPRVALPSARFVLHIIMPRSPDPEEYDFPVNSGPGEQVFELGLTGTDWPGKKTHPVAWRLELQSASGETLASAESFLWSKPDQK
jgi:hypothetical protein